jgi:hypothetical protein
VLSRAFVSRRVCFMTKFGLLFLNFPAQKARDICKEEQRRTREEIQMRRAINNSNKGSHPMGSESSKYSKTDRHEIGIKRTIYISKKLSNVMCTLYIMCKVHKMWCMCTFGD